MVTKAIRLSLDAAQRDIDLKQLEKALETSDVGVLNNIFNSSMLALEEKFMDVMPPVLSDTLKDGGSMAGRTAKVEQSYKTAEVTLSFDRTNPLAEQWAFNHSSQLILEISEETKRAIQVIIGNAYQQQYTVQQAARLIRNQIGLNERLALAVSRAYEVLLAADDSVVLLGKTPVRIPIGGLSDAIIAKRINDYSQRLLNYRSRMIARTETIRAANVGQRQLWNQAVGNGLLTGYELREWITGFDERTCTVCEGLHGEKAGLNEPFPGGIMDPPAHPQCRCSVALSNKMGARKTPFTPPSLEDQTFKPTRVIINPTTFQ